MNILSLMILSLKISKTASLIWQYTIVQMANISSQKLFSPTSLNKCVWQLEDFQAMLLTKDINLVDNLKDMNIEQGNLNKNNINYCVKKLISILEETPRMSGWSVSSMAWTDSLISNYWKNYGHFSNPITTWNTSKFVSCQSNSEW